MIILGIDPGTSIVGFGVIKKDGSNLMCQEYGCIKTTPKIPDVEKLSLIRSELDDLIKKVNDHSDQLEARPDLD